MCLLHKPPWHVCIVTLRMLLMNRVTENIDTRSAFMKKLREPFLRRRYFEIFLVVAVFCPYDYFEIVLLLDLIYSLSLFFI